MENIAIKQVGLKDVDALQQISRKTFTETFSANNVAENMDKYMEQGFSSTKLAEEVSNAASRFYFALLDNKVIGYLKLNTGRAQTELKDEKGLEIERIYVLKDYHGQKVGQLLYDKAIAIARELRSDYVWLGVWEENPRAIRFYQKNGFAAFDKHIFNLGGEEQTDIMMKKTLTHEH